MKMTHREAVWVLQIQRGTLISCHYHILDKSCILDTTLIHNHLLGQAYFNILEACHCDLTVAPPATGLSLSQCKEVHRMGFCLFISVLVVFAKTVKYLAS